MCGSALTHTAETCLDWPGSTSAPSASGSQPFGPNKDGKHSSYAVKHRAPRAAGVLGPNHKTQPFCCESAASWPRSDSARLVRARAGSVSYVKTARRCFYHNIRGSWRLIPPLHGTGTHLLRFAAFASLKVALQGFLI